MPKFSHVTSTINETYGSKIISEIRSLPIEGQIILIVYAQQMDTTKSTTKVTVSKLHELYCNQSRKLQHECVRSIGDFTSIVQTLINESVMTTSSKKCLNRTAVLKPRVRLEDVENALYPQETTKFARQRDTPTEPQQKFFKRFASAANRGHSGSYYRKGANEGTTEQNGKKVSP